jgi:hypothetical protein
MPPLFRKPRGKRRRETITRRLFTLDSLPKDSSSPEENSFDSLCFQPRKCRTTACREYKSQQAPRHCPSVWPFGQSQLSSWLFALVPPRAPTSPDCLARRRRVHLARGIRLCLSKDHRPMHPAASAAERIGCLLIAHSPTTAFQSRR